jgi:hypothetical protein
MAEEKCKDQSLEKVKTPQRRLVPDIPAIENFLKRELGRDFAMGLKERDKGVAVNAVTPAVSVGEDPFQAMLIADIKKREDKGKVKS